MNLLPIPLLEIFINSREAERYLSKPDFALVMIKITLALIKLSPKDGSFSTATTKLTRPSTGCGIFSQEKPVLFAQIFLSPLWRSDEAIRSDDPHRPAAEAC
jgi:hypothetical protein